jgi:DNA-binding transcriptional ArsR family regulator
MKTQNAVAALAALAQDNRLDIFRLLVEAGPEGMPAGRVAEALDLAPNTLTFHFDRLRLAGLITVRREGRSMIYAARFETMGATLNFAAAMNAYTLTERATWANFKNRQNLEILTEGDVALFNPYGSILVNPAKWPQVKFNEAKMWHEWLTSKPGLDAITSYKINGEELFFPPRSEATH